MGGPVDLDHTLSLLHTRDEVACLHERNVVLCVQGQFRANAAEAHRGGDSAITATRGLIVDEAAMCPREHLDGFPGTLKSLAKCGRLQTHRLGGFERGQIENLTEDVGEAVGPVEALQHRERAPHLHLLGEKAPLGVRRTFVRETVEQILRERIEAQLLALDTALLHVEQVVRRDAVGPRHQTAAKVEL